MGAWILVWWLAQAYLDGALGTRTTSFPVGDIRRGDFRQQEIEIPAGEDVPVQVAEQAARAADDFWVLSWLPKLSVLAALASCLLPVWFFEARHIWRCRRKRKRTGLHQWNDGVMVHTRLGSLLRHAWTDIFSWDEVRCARIERHEQQVKHAKIVTHLLELDTGDRSIILGGQPERRLDRALELAEAIQARLPRGS